MGKGGAVLHEIGQRGERDGEAARIADGVRRQRIGDELALDPDAMRQPPGDGVVEQQRFDRALQQVHEIVVATHMDSFVEEMYVTREAAAGQAELNRFDAIFGPGPRQPSL